jgi:hypothetical protein
MKSFLAFPLLLAPAAAAAVSVEAANGDWSKLPQLSQRGYEHLNEKMMAKLYEIAASNQCPSLALTQDRLNFRIGFATQYDTDGKLARVILPKLDCSEAESVAGGAVLEMLQAGDYSPTGKSRNGWYQGTLGFSFAGKSALDPAVVKVAAQPGAVKGQNPTEMVCEKVEVMGTRLDSNRVCMTRAEWAQRRRADRDEVERVQTQRGCGATMTC